MKIYTKGGDDGTTALFGGKRVHKDALRIEAYGIVDELNSVIGVVRAHAPMLRTNDILSAIQHSLFCLGADLATEQSQKNAGAIPRIAGRDIQTAEAFIDEIDAQLPPLTHFILPGGAPSAAFLHLARTVCRNAERACVALSKHEDIGAQVVIYLNRLSDLLFVLARYENNEKGISETKWGV